MTLLSNYRSVLTTSHGHSPPLTRRCLSPSGLLALIAVSLLFCWASIHYFRRSESKYPHLMNLLDKSPLSLGDPRDLAQRLLSVHRHLEQSLNAKRPPALEDLHELKLVATELYPPIEMNDVPLSGTPLVCPEHYYGPKFAAGWGILNCTGAKPLHELVTAVFNAQEFIDQDAKKWSLQLIRDFYVSYPKMKIIVIGSGLSNGELAGRQDLDGSLVTLLTGRKTSPSSPGQTWNIAIERVKTPFVLVARDVFRFSGGSSSLERILRVVSEVPGVAAVGGAVRNATGHWHAGCFQSSLKNYVLRFQKGYHYSRNESMFCDYVDGPFVTYTHLMKSIILDSKLKSDVVFQDFFLTLSRTWLSMLCPDVMFYANGRMAGGRAVLSRETWLHLAAKYELNRILVDFQHYQVLHKFSCSDVRIFCKNKIRTTSYYTIPVCCQEEFARGLLFWDTFCAEHHFRNYFDSGSCLGAVKMSDLIPWDLDGDSGYPEVNYTFIKESSSLFARNGFELGAFEDPVCCDNMPNGMKRSYMKMYIAGMYIEMWGDWWHPHDTFLYENLSVALDTRINIHGVWVNGPPNPGFYARKRYGVECLRHAQSWSQTGLATSWEPYQAGKFKTCRHRGHHACLEQFPADGNIAFIVPD